MQKKASDKIRHPFLRETLTLGTEGNYCNILKITREEPTPNTTLDSARRQAFPLGSGTRQLLLHTARQVPDRAIRQERLLNGHRVSDLQSEKVLEMFQLKISVIKRHISQKKKKAGRRKRFPSPKQTYIR